MRIKPLLFRRKLTILLILSISLNCIGIFLHFRHLHDGNDCIEPIDVVYTWVNGSDPRFRRELHEYLQQNANNREDSSPQRFDDKSELKFSLRSLEKHAAWINRVFIVTNGQIPYWLDLDNEKVTLVTHEEIFDDRNHLPTFSSPAIEVHLHKIPGLSRRFLYFNDDMFLGSDIHLEDFWTETRGFLLNFAWPLPPCSDDCAWMYVGDGECDQSCMTDECQMDGGDCDNLPEVVTNELGNLRHISNFLQQYESNSTMMNVNEAVERHNERVKRHNRNWRRRRKAKPRRNSTTTNNNEKTIDAYAASLRHTNRLLNLKYDFRPRFIPAHSPILLDREILANLQAEFSREMALTASHKVRHVDDLQYAFTYDYFLMNQVIERSVGEIFDEFDTDRSGTWSDREIRTLLTRLYALPLSYATVDHFEVIINNCATNLDLAHNAMAANERYEGSKLPTITKQLIENCPRIARHLAQKFGTRPKYKYDVINSAHGKMVHFKMLNSNVSDVVLHLDEIRQKPRKFVCLNDNMNGSQTVDDDDNHLIRALLYDFYMSLFPQRSRFELDAQFRNKFQYVDELRGWRTYRTKLKLIIGCCVVFLVYVTVYTLCVKSVVRLRR